MALQLAGSINLSGSLAATVISIQNGGGGLVSSSQQVQNYDVFALNSNLYNSTGSIKAEISGLESYTSSLKSAAIVSSSTQIQNYSLFAVTSSANTFYGNQGISGSLNVTSATGTNVTPQLTVNNTTTNGYGIVRLVGAGRGGIIDFYNTSSAQASISANDGALQIYTNGDSTGTPKVTIDSAGSLFMVKNNIIGTNTVDGSDDGYLFLSSAGAAGASRGAFVQCFGNEYSGDSGVLQLCAGDNSGVGYINFRTGNGNDRMRISYNGSIGAPSGTNIYNASDIRLKQNISTTTYGLNTISLLNPVKFNWVDGFEPSENGKDMLGFVAQEVLEVIPEAIESFGGDINLNGQIIDNPLRVNEKFLIPVLTKAIQEQQTIIDSLIARIEALENN